MITNSELFDSLQKCFPDTNIDDIYFAFIKYIPDVCREKCLQYVENNTDKIINFIDESMSNINFIGKSLSNIDISNLHFDIANYIKYETYSTKKNNTNLNTDENNYMNEIENNTTHLSTENIPDDKINNYEFVNHPSHYNQWSYEVIDMMIKIYGKETTAMWCELTAFKYAVRMGFKPGESVQQEVDKRNWYLSMAKKLRQN